MVRPRSGKNALVQSLDAARCPVYLLDDQRRLLYANAELLTWIGAAAADVVGIQCHYHSDVTISLPESRIAGLCPPPEAWQAASSTGEIVCYVDGVWHRRAAQFIGLGVAGHDVTGGVLVIAASDDLLPAEQRTKVGGIAGWDAEKLHTEVARLRAEFKQAYDISRFLGNSPAVRQARRRIELAVASHANVLISGPVGSGREHIARLIHTASDSFGVSPMVTLACPLLDDELLRSTVDELIQRCSELEMERPPCLLLLDVDQLSPDAQRSLTEVLDMGELELRSLATSRASGAALAARDDFRPELLALLSTVDIHLPALRDRRQDIPLLIQAEVERANREGRGQVQGFTRSAMEICLEHDWPENIDELFAAVREAYDASGGMWVTPETLPKRFFHGRDAVRYAVPEKETIDLDSYLQRIETELILRALDRAKGNKSEAARLLGIARTRLLRRIDLD